MDVERKPKWATPYDGHDGHYPKCDRCGAFARWSIGRFEEDGALVNADATIRWFACGSHLNRVLDEADWLLDAVMIYDLTGART